MALDGMDRMAREEFQGTEPKFFGTDADNPENGRIFVWTKMGWFERVEGPWGDVAFIPVADSEDELRDWLAQDDPNIDLVALDINSEFGRMVLQEFKEQSEDALYPGSPENSSEEPFSEQDVT